MALPRSVALSDKQLTRILTREAETYSVEEALYPEGVNLFAREDSERWLRELVLALEEGDEHMWTVRPKLVPGKDATGNLVYRVHTFDPLRSVSKISDAVLVPAPEDPRFEGWAGALLVVRRVLELIEDIESGRVQAHP